MAVVYIQCAVRYFSHRQYALFYHISGFGLLGPGPRPILVSTLRTFHVSPPAAMPTAHSAAQAQPAPHSECQCHRATPHTTGLGLGLSTRSRKKPARSTAAATACPSPSPVGYQSTELLKFCFFRGACRAANTWCPMIGKGRLGLSGMWRAV